MTTEKPILAWEEGEERIIADCKIFNVIEKQFHRSKETSNFYVIDSKDWALAIGITPNREILLVEQYRFGTASLHLELPGGIINKGEAPTKAAERELLEETGFSGQKSKLIGTSHPNPAFLNNQAHFVLLEDCVQTHTPNWDEHEALIVRPTPIEEAFKLVQNGTITHGVTLNALAFLHFYL